MNFDHKRIVVTGAASGIGKALVEQLSQHEGQIVAADRDDIGLRKTVGSLANDRIMAFTCDLSLADDVDDLFSFALARMGGVDVLFANAGFGYCEQIQSTDWQHIAEIYQTNVFAPIYSLVKMKELHRDSKYWVVITGSVLGRIALEGYALYASTKAALDRFIEGYRLEMASRGRLILVYPLPVRTQFFRTASDAPVPWFAQGADTVAKAIIRGVERDRRTIYTSWLLPLMLFVDRIFPPARRWYQALDSRSFRSWLQRQGRSSGQASSGSPDLS